MNLDCAMPSIAELRTLPVPERIRLVTDLWDTIADDQQSVGDPPSVVQEIRARRQRHLENPSAGAPWESAKERIRNRRG
jgi:putative addiction module component (TIGR02574 family)